MIIKPILTKKSINLAKNKIFCFFVLPDSNKIRIKKDFEKMFEIKVKKIRTTTKKPILRGANFQQKHPGKTYTKKTKKAFIEPFPNQKNLKNLEVIFSSN